jgi:hypothetical protein
MNTFFKIASVFYFVVLPLILAHYELSPTIPYVLLIVISFFVRVYQVSEALIHKLRFGYYFQKRYDARGDGGHGLTFLALLPSLYFSFIGLTQGIGYLSIPGVIFTAILGLGLYFELK